MEPNRGLLTGDRPHKIRLEASNKFARACHEKSARTLCSESLETREFVGPRIGDKGVTLRIAVTIAQLARVVLIV